MPSTVLDSDRSARSSRPLSLCFHRRQRPRRPLFRPPTISNHTPVGTENPVRYLHPLRGYKYTSVGTENPVRYLHPLRGYNHTPVGTENPVRYLHPSRGYNHTPVGTENPVRYLHPLQGYNHSMKRQINLKASLAYCIFCPVDGVHLKLTLL